MRGIALHGFDQVRNQVVTLLELHVDIGEGLSDPLAERDETVVGRERKQHENDDDADERSSRSTWQKLLMRRRKGR